MITMVYDRYEIILYCGFGYFWWALIDRETLKGINVFLFYLHVILVQFSHEFNCFSIWYILVLFQSVIFLRVSWKKYNNNYFLKIGYVFWLLFLFLTDKSQFVRKLSVRKTDQPPERQTWQTDRKLSSGFPSVDMHPCMVYCKKSVQTEVSF